MTYWGFFPKGSGSSKKPATKVVRILTEVYAEAMCEKKDTAEGNCIDECCWLSYLIKKGLEKNKTWREFWR